MATMISVPQFCGNAFKSLRAASPRGPAEVNYAYSPLLEFASAAFLSAAIGSRAEVTAVSAAGPPPPLPDPSAVSLAADAIHAIVGGDEIPLTLTLKSQIWIDKGLVVPQFTRCMNIFGSRSRVDIYCTKFQEAGKNDEVKEKAENWLYDLLEGRKPKKSLVPLPIEDYTRLVTCHALHFRGEWEDKFFLVSGGHSKFHGLVGGPVEGPFLTSKAKLCVGVYDGFKVLRLPYKKGDDVRQFSMYIFLPDAQDGISKLGDRMYSDVDFMVRHIPKTAKRLRDLKIPDGLNGSTLCEFKVLAWPSSDEYEDSESYCGCKTIPLINLVRNETVKAKEGSGDIKKCAVEVADVDFVADHPFIWAVREDVTGVVLFTGHFSDLSPWYNLWK